MVFIIFLNGCATVKLQKSIDEAKNEKISLSEYTDAMYKDWKIYLGYVASNNSEILPKTKISSVAEYDLDKFNKDPESKVIFSPLLYENTYIQSVAAGIDVPICFIDEASLKPHGCGSTYYHSFIESNIIDCLETPVIYVTYHQTIKTDGSIHRNFNNSEFLFIWHENENGEKRVKYLVLKTPIIETPNKIKEYSLKSLYPFALVADIPVWVGGCIILFIAVIFGFKG